MLIMIIILPEWVKGYNSSITTILCQVSAVNNTTVWLAGDFNA